MPASKVSSPAHDRLVDLGPARHVVGLDRQHLLQGVGRAVGLQRPALHLAEALAAELRLAAERLLRDQAVGPDRARVDLVVDQMPELEHVDVADRDLAIEGLAAAPVDQRSPGPTHRSRDSSSSRRMSASCGAVEHRALRPARRRAGCRQARSARPPRTCRCRLLAVDGGPAACAGCPACRPSRPGRAGGRFAAEIVAGPAEVGLQDLADVHPRRHAEWIEHDVDGRAVLEMGMSSIGAIFEITPLLPCRPAILSPGCSLRFTATNTLTILSTPGRQLVAALQLLDLVVETLLQQRSPSSS